MKLAEQAIAKFEQGAHIYNYSLRSQRNMAKFILGKKIEMSQLWEENKVIPITLIEAGPCFVTETKEGKVQLGFEKLKEKKIKKSQVKKPYRYLKEFKNDQELKVGEKIDVSIFEKGDKVKVSGLTKGKGFQGAVKKWGFSGFGKSHGVKHGERALGSIGSSFPERVLKGKKMPGRMGNKRITVINLKVIKVDKEDNLMVLKGAVPGRRGTLLEING